MLPMKRLILLLELNPTFANYAHLNRDRIILRRS